VEYGSAEQVLGSPTHPYTAALLEAQPRPGVARGELRPIPGTPPLPSALTGGCAFAPRCDRQVAACHQTDPELEKVERSVLVACHRPLEVLRSA
jgi:oligopeptide/dipeptide ABC transporter ATP-binding protein